MARPRTRYLWLAVLLVAVGIGLGAGAGGDFGGRGDERPSAHQSAAASLTGDAVEVAIVPARTEVAPGSGGRLASARSFLPLAVALLAAAGAAGLRGRRSLVPAFGPQPLLARRHAIALRAPPAFQLV